VAILNTTLQVTRLRLTQYNTIQITFITARKWKVNMRRR